MTEDEKKIIREAVELVNHFKEQIPDGTRVITVRNAVSLILAEIIVTQTSVDPFAGLEAFRELHTYIGYQRQKAELRNKEKYNETTDIKAN